MRVAPDRGRLRGSEGKKTTQKKNQESRIEKLGIKRQKASRKQARSRAPGARRKEKSGQTLNTYAVTNHETQPARP